MIALAENKKQHYVPKLYMKNFTQDGQLLSVYNIARKQCYSAVPYDDQCYKNYYYGRDAVWEKRLSAMETVWGVLFQKILTKSSLSDADIDAIRQFALYQLQRTVASNEYFVQQKEEFLLEYGKMFYKKRGVPFNETAKAICKERAKRDFSPADWLEFADEYMAYIQDLETVVIDYRTEGELITSDVPVVAINPFHQPSIGYACMGLIILFPISSHILVVLYDSKMYPKNKGKLFIESTDEDEVSNLNALQVISADKILLAEHDEAFTTIPDNAWESYTVSVNVSEIRALQLFWVLMIRGCFALLLEKSFTTVTSLLGRCATVSKESRSCAKMLYREKGTVSGKRSSICWSRFFQ